MPNDFVLCDKFSKTLQSDVEKIFEKGYNDINSEVVDSVDITKCDRRVYYKLIGVNTFCDKKRRSHHSHIVNKWEGFLLQAKTFELLDKNLIVADQNHNITSRIDIVGKFDDIPVALMIREVDKDTFQNNSVKRSHVVELMTQMWLVEVNDGFLVYEDIEDKKINMFHILPNVSVLNAVKQKLLALGKCKMAGTLPERKYETSDSKECQECCFAEKCWRDIGDG